MRIFGLLSSECSFSRLQAFCSISYIPLMCYSIIPIFARFGDWIVILFFSHDCDCCRSVILA
jgi:uncharacterized membrane protein